MVVLEVPSDRVGASVKPFGDELSADLDDPLDDRRSDAVGVVLGRLDRASNAASPSVR